MWKINNSDQHYGVVSMCFHWIMALIIFCVLGLGLYVEDLPLSPQKLQYIGWHKALGIMVLVLVALRLGWKITQIRPALSPALGKYMILAANMGHMALYGCMISLPISGWCMSSAAGFPVSVFGWFTLPALMEPNKQMRHVLADVHEALAYGLIVLIILHVLAALMHHYIHKDTVLRRMLPW